MLNRYWNKHIRMRTHGLDGEDFLRIREKIAVENLQRMRIFLGITFLIQTLLIVAVDLPSLHRARFGGAGLGDGEPLWLPIAFLCLHAALVLMMVGGYLGTRHFAMRLAAPQADLAGFERFFFLAGETTLLLMTGIAVLDQLRAGDISAFALNCLLVAAFMYMVPPMNVLIFLPPYIGLAMGILVLQKDEAAMTGTLTNATAFFFTMLIFSIILFRSHFKQLADERLLEIANRKLDALSLHDQLTGLANRRLFAMIFDREVARLKRAGGTTHVVILDIDHFKAINDKYGHPVGDRVLTDLSLLLKAGLRETDLAARWGGEEFILLLPDLETAAAMRIAERLRLAVAQRRIEEGGETFGYTASFGLARVNPMAENPMHEAYSHADKALYAAKAQGRDRCVAYADTMEADASAHGVFVP